MSVEPLSDVVGLRRQNDRAWHIEVRPATVFDDVTTHGGPEAARCERVLVPELPHPVEGEPSRSPGTARGERVRRARCSKDPPGVLAYDGDESSAGRRCIRARTRLSRAIGRSRTSTISTSGRSGACGCAGPRGRASRTRSSRAPSRSPEIRRARDRGLSGRQQGREGRPDDGVRRNEGLFEKAGFTKVADTDSVLNGFPRVLMRLDLR